MTNGNGAVAGNGINEKSGNVPRTRSFLDKLGYKHFNTARFGEYTPFFVQEGVEGDERMNLLSSEKVDSYTLKAPLMQDIKLRKDLFMVPRQALLPLNWEKFFTNPVIGDDVPDDCGTTVQSFWQKISSFISTWLSSIQASISALDPTDPSYNDAVTACVNDFFRWLFTSEMFFSNGNLLSSLRIHGSKFMKFDGTSFDKFFDSIFGGLTSFSFNLNWNGSTIMSSNDTDLSIYGYHLSFREYCDLMRDDPYSVSIILDNVDEPFPFTFDVTAARTFLTIVSTINVGSFASNDDHLDLARPLSYQMVCHHYFSNDHVDYVYSADLYRQYVGYFFFTIFGNFTRFNVNGIDYQYDYLSARYFDLILNDALNLIGLDRHVRYFCSIFSYRHSLRFVDYFVGSKTRPLAIGNTDVTVSGGVASVVDITRNIQKQRFLNAVNRVGRKIADYAKMMVGVDVAPDYHNPLYLGSTVDVIYGDRSEYTGNVTNAEPNNVSSILKSAGGRYQFEWNLDRDSIIIGVQSFDIDRVYSESIDRQCFHVNRFDMFNPFMQFIGDQMLYKSEITLGGETPFGYQTRHMEYKQSFDVCSGGFVENLPAWIFKAERGFRKYEENQSPKFIRSFASEFDQFYVRLTGYSLGSYFHFIIENINDCSGSRPMAKTPDILQ